MFTTINDLQRALAERNYVAERGLATALFLSLKLPKPLFLEGEAGVGKTEVAKTLASILGTDLIRLQCYEGLDIQHGGVRVELCAPDDAYPPHGSARAFVGFRRDRAFRPAVPGEAPPPAGGHIPGPGRPVLLIDELDRADEEFEAYLLELLSDFQITVPEVGTFQPKEPPAVIITSNRTREIHDALKRRCLYHWIEYPASRKS